MFYLGILALSTFHSIVTAEICSPSMAGAHRHRGAGNGSRGSRGEESTCSGESMKAAVEHGEWRNEVCNLQWPSCWNVFDLKIGLL